MRLSDQGIINELIKGRIVIDPIDWENDTSKTIKEQIEDSSQIQPASVDLRLGDELHLYDKDLEIIDTKDMPDPDEIRQGEELVLNSGEFALASTKETVKIPNDFDAEIKGRSSIGRAGSHIHTAGWVDPGFEGQVTLELINHASAPVKLYEGMRICQIIFGRLESPALIGYGDQKDSKYQHQQGATGSRIDEDFK